MKKYIDPGHSKKTLTLLDNIVYSTCTDLEGNSLELKLSVLLQNGNSEAKLAIGADDPKEDHTPKPALLWIPGGGWRGADKNLMLGEMSAFANAGYVVVSLYYRSSAQGHYPDQIRDVKAAIRFLRANAARFEIDPRHIGVFGRSAGGYLAALAAMNLAGDDVGEHLDQSSQVQACCDMFGPVDLLALMNAEEKRFADPGFRWHRLEDTHGGALLGGDPATMKQRAAQASVPGKINPGMCPILILHGDNDPIVPLELSSEPFYQALCDAGMEHKAELYVLRHGGHGSREFFQDSVVRLMVDFFDRCLK